MSLQSRRPQGKYTGALGRDLAGVAAKAIGPMTISQDGTQLFVSDTGAKTIVAVDATGGQVAHTHALPSPSTSTGTAGTAVACVRPNRYPLLITPSLRTYDTTNC